MKTTIKGVDCYGKLVKGNGVEVITNRDSFMLDNSDYSTWEDLVNYLLSDDGYVAGVQELVAC